MRKYNLICVVLLLSFGLTGCSILDNISFNSSPQFEERQRVERSLHTLIQAYENGDIGTFSELLSSDLSGDRPRDSLSLRMDVQRDFTAFQDMDITYTLNNVTSDHRGRAFVSIQYTRAYTDMKTGKRQSDKGTASFIFINQDGKYRLLQQKRPLFGVN